MSEWEKVQALSPKSVDLSLIKTDNSHGLLPWKFSSNSNSKKQKTPNN